MRKIILTILAVVALTLFGAAPANAAFKFGPHDTQCQAQPDQPNCVGSH